MSIAQLILYLMIGTPEERARLRQGAKNFCEKHLIADDPYDELTKKLKEEKRQLTDEQKRMIKDSAEKIKREEEDEH